MEIQTTKTNDSSTMEELFGELRPLVLKSFARNNWDGAEKLRNLKTLVAEAERFLESKNFIFKLTRGDDSFSLKRCIENEDASIEVKISGTHLLTVRATALVYVFKELDKRESPQSAPSSRKRAVKKKAPRK